MVPCKRRESTVTVLVKATSYTFKQMTTFLSTKEQFLPNARETSEKKHARHDKNFFMEEFQGSFAIFYQSPCQCSSEISFLQL